MSTLLASVSGPFAAVERFLAENGDSRIGKLALMGSPWTVVAIAALYVYFSYDFGPNRLMKGRRALDLVWLVRAFNCLLLLLNVWLLSRYFALYNWGLDTLGCSPVNANDTSAKALESINVCHIFLISRILELLDTVWIALRKKNRQITFLHVFHHSFVLLMTWFYFRMAPGGSSALFPIVNGTTHCIMYTYYTLSTFHSLKPYLWWKKYVTELQLLQFVLLGVHFALASLTPNCGYPRPLALGGLLISIMFYSLFFAFYRETYTAKQHRLLTQTRLKDADQAGSQKEQPRERPARNGNNNIIGHSIEQLQPDECK